MMKGIVARSGKCELLTGLPVPKPTANQVLIKVHATALNRADTLQRKGVYPPPPGVTEVLGLELSGTLEPSGEPVMALVSGGAFAEYCVADKGSVMPVPKNVKLDHAAGIPEAWLTAFQLLHVVGRIRAKDVVMIHAGASGVGTAAIQLCKHVFGCENIITTSSKKKFEVCAAMGATLCLDRDAERWDLHGLQHVDLMLDCVGGGAYVEKNIQALGMDSRWVLFALMNTTPGASEKIMRAVLGKRISLLGSTLRSRSEEYKTDLVNEFTRMCLPKFDQGVLKPVLDKHEFVGLDKINEALDYMETNQSTGKILIKL